MSRFFLFLRYALFPLLALLGVGLLVAGYFEWRRFYADLYLEETAAIEAAVAAGLEVEYRREGEPRARVALRRTDWGGQPVETAWDRERSTVPDNAPFLGRVESVVLKSPRYASAPPPKKEIREDLSRLPGMKNLETFVDPTLAIIDPSLVGGVGVAAPGTASAASARPPTLEQALGRRPPDLPESELTVEQATEPLPRGRSLDGAERETLVADIAEAWRRPSDIASYVARSRWIPAEDTDYQLSIIEMADGDRFASSLEASTSLGADPGYRLEGNGRSLDDLRVVDGKRACALDRIEDRWARVATFVDDDDVRAKRFAPYLAAPRLIPGLVADSDRFDSHFLSIRREDPLGPNGENVAAIERIDDARLRIELLPSVTTPFQPNMRMEMIVRQDLHFAVERSLATMEWPAGAGEPTSRVEAFVNRRLERLDDAVYASEMLRVERSFVKANGSSAEERNHERVERLLTTVVSASDLPGSAFDPRTYDPTPWPEPRSLPPVRSYVMLWSIGGVLVAIGLVGPLFARRRPLRRKEVASEEAANEASVRRSPRLRFGLAALFAASLGMISVAGAAKQIRDEATRDVERIARLEGAAQYERREPRFPWSLFSTPALPIDAPVKRIVVGEIAGDDENAAVTELLASPDLDSFLDKSQDDGPLPTNDVLGEAAKALDRRLPKLPDSVDPPQIAIWLEEFPDGETMGEPERSAFVAKMVSAWIELRKRIPRRYLLVESHDHYGAPEERVMLRDGDRFWSLGGREGASVTTYDAAYVYRFNLQERGASLIERTRRTSSPMTWAAFPDVELYAMATPMPQMIGDGSESLFAIDQPGRFPDAPYAFPMHLYADAENFEAVAQAALDPAGIVRVARIDDDRVRVDFRAVEVDLSKNPPTVASSAGDAADRNEWDADDDDTTDSVWIDIAADPTTNDARVSVAVSYLSIVVREDLDFAVERSVVRTEVRRRPSNRGAADPYFDLDDAQARISYVTNRLIRDANGLVMPEASRIGDDRRGVRTWWDSRYGYEFEPEIDERIFASPSMAQLQPIPEPVRRRIVTWPWATGALSLALFAGLGVRRVAGTIRGKRASKVQTSS